MSTSTTVVWTEIPVTDLDAATTFYSEVFGWSMSRDDSGPSPTIHLALLDNTEARVEPLKGDLRPTC